jgi:peptidoglycan hydrolase-like protein with peptidoglycan-binding domain
MAVITATIQPNERRPEVTEIQKALIGLGANIDGPELFTATSAGALGPKTQAAITALLRRFGFPQQAHFNAHVGRLLNIAVGAEVGNSAALQRAVRESFAVIQLQPNAGPDELAVLARYGVIARDFTTARQIIDVIPENSSAGEEKRKIAAIVKRDTQQPPEILNPENYYTVLYEYVSRSRIKSLINRP